MREHKVYQVEYRVPSGDWYFCGPECTTLSQAKSRMGFEMHEDPEFAYRIIEKKLVHSVVLTTHEEDA